MRSTTKPTVAIIGAGFAGIGMAIRLKQAGYPVTVFEREADLGGVWRDNTYPGAACDIPSHLYSFSFEPKPDWTRRYATQPEILDYLRHCVHKYGLGAHIRFGTGIATAEFDEQRGHWRLTTEGGETIEIDALVSACGQLRIPALPDLLGRDTFAGPAFHTARWDHRQDLTGKRVGVIGTGATAVQVVPALVDSVHELRLFQRTPPYLVPRPDRAYPAWQRRLFARFPLLQKLGRAKLFAQHEARVLGFGYAPRMLRVSEVLFRRRLRRQVPDPDRRAALTPDYRIGCKRVLVSSDFHPAMNRANLALVTDSVREIVPEGVRTDDGRVHELDVLVYATGFRTQDFLTPMRVLGRGGRDLDEEWRDGARAHLGITVPGFPNFFLLYGPNTNLGHNSIIYMIESQIAYVLDALQRLHTRRLRYLDVRVPALREFDEHVQRRLRNTVFSTGCDSWYIADNGRNANNWPSSVLAYRRLTRSLDPAEYEHAR
ncbi:cation diffusion facilitator CzcD-associated flavoprotein CzcO [Halopolyspora algeriensis]|uniref:Cation diffusion facilitator CzcD-associated flavoprotein CzcO n=1 Tax=Halopolyspora algeriensis TaxID=1500506 RepID=A0A368VY42_9ACTN|nr:NAD(P)/FAD-dependent oxidoreductase [Halopolyspora algeriensis]RCW44504.1 cation diffusion facilitator CzcD-associated flavoprotein CzcO [Halopolyspora algeriensis]TQM55864.1 cation diffusion facilitator CzcD-associated flavoprotein CzcO [Halopolyspora algeriensis]